MPNNNTLSKKVKEIIAKEEKYVTPANDRIYPIFLKHIENARVEDVDGNKYIDFVQGSGCVSVGLGNKELIKTINDNINNLSHTAFPYSNEIVVEYAKKICEITPGNYPKRMAFALAGMEAVDGAFKLARWYTRRPQQIAYIGAHAGFTGFALSITAHYPAQHKGFHPLIPGTVYAPYPYSYRCPLGLSNNINNKEKNNENCDTCSEKTCCEESSYKCLDYLENYLMKTVAPPENVSAIFFEPFLGPGGMVPSPKEYVKGLREICDKHNILLVADEILSGFGKTGKMFAMEHYAPIEPDITIFGKGLGNAMFPVAGFVARREIMEWEAGAHTSTYHGYALGCAIGLKVIEIIERDNLVDRAAKLGAHALKRLNEMKEKHEIIGDVRGKGLFIGIELVKDRKTKEPASDEALQIAYAAFKDGLLLQWNGLNFNVFKLYPNLNIPKEDLDKGLDIFENAIIKFEQGKIDKPTGLPPYYLISSQYH